MNYRILGKTGFKVSEVSLGTWQLGGKWGEKFNPETARQILEKSVENGINFFDTADVYNNGESEIAIGKFLKKVGQKIYVATKCGRQLNPHISEGYNRENITKYINESLARMELEAIDLIQLKSNIAASEMPPIDKSRTEAVKQIYDRYIREYVQDLW